MTTTEPFWQHTKRNNDRAKLGLAALKAGQENNPDPLSDPYTAAMDTVTNILHWLASAGGLPFVGDFSELIDDVTTNFNVERAEPDNPLQRASDGLVAAEPALSGAIINGDSDNERATISVAGPIGTSASGTGEAETDVDGRSAAG